MLRKPTHKSRRLTDDENKKKRKKPGTGKRGKRKPLVLGMLKRASKKMRRSGDDTPVSHPVKLDKLSRSRHLAWLKTKNDQSKAKKKIEAKK